MMRNGFSRLHPLTNLLYFVFVIGFSMFVMHPVCMLISLCCALLNAVSMNGRRTALFSLRVVLPMLLLIGVVNPVLNHQGVTILGYLPWGNPLTLESILYGVASGVMLAAVVLWFSSFHTVMSSDKLVCLFGRAAPALGLVLSMTLRFVPRFITQLRELRAAQRGVTPERTGVRYKLKSGVKTLSVLITLALENSLDTADSMRGRGYGLKGRSAYSLYRYTAVDTVVTVMLTLCAAACIALLATKAVGFQYFPSLKGNLGSGFDYLFYAIYAAVGVLPFMMNLREGIRWKQSKSKI